MYYAGDSGREGRLSDRLRQCLGNALARRLDDLGYHVFAGFQNKGGNIDADMLKEDCSGRLHTLQLDITSETQVNTMKFVPINTQYLF